jgi:hypothetical protein
MRIALRIGSVLIGALGAAAGCAEAPGRDNPGDRKVQVGDPAPVKGCVAKNAEGEVFRLADVVGTQPLVLLTYRAHW